MKAIWRNFYNPWSGFSAFAGRLQLIKVAFFKNFTIIPVKFIDTSLFH